MKKTTAAATLAFAGALSGSAMADVETGLTIPVVTQVEQISGQDKIVSAVLTTRLDSEPASSTNTVFIPRVTLSDCSTLAAVATNVHKAVKATISCIGENYNVEKAYKCQGGKCTELKLQP